MGKKKIRKHQKEPNDSSSSSEDEKQDHPGKACPHVDKSVSISGLKKVLKTGIKLGKCELCQKSSLEEKKGIEDDADHQQRSENSPDTWLCLQCGIQGCDNCSKRTHALHHFSTSMPERHALFISVSTSSVWCYECSSEVTVDSSKKLLECVNLMQKLQAGDAAEERGKLPTGKAPIANVKEVELNGANTSSDDNPKKKNVCANAGSKNTAGKSKTDTKLNVMTKVRGLSNLGNTCFFNAIMQNLAQTHWLIRLVEERSPKGVAVCLPGVRHDANADVQASENKEWQLEPLTLKLPESGTLTQALANFFNDMLSSSKVSVMNPSQVFGQICRKSPQFRGSKQQDSHELLRHLLDGVRTEETKRQRLGILHAFNLPPKVDPDTVDEQTKRRVKAYGRQANHTLIDNVFSGQLISTVLCKECQVSSQVFEPFLDLSLPVAEEKPLRPGMQKRASAKELPVEVNLCKDASVGPSKYSERKARRRAKKEAKRNRYRRSKSSNEIGAMFNNSHESSRSPLSDDAKKTNTVCDEEETSEQSDADIEDNAESESTAVTNKRCQDGAPSRGTADENKEPAQTPKKDRSSETLDLASPGNPIDDLCSQMSDATLTETGNSHDNLLEAMTGDSAVKTASEAELTSGYANSVGTPVSERDGREKVERCHERQWKFKQDWIAKSLTTLAARYQPESHECSVLSCLHQFTAPELLTGNNRFGCENCTKVKMEKMGGNKAEGKKCELVYSNASKQLLIFSPPAVLTLHLKRFQQVGYSLRKVNRHVDFPLVLDLAPFCSSICLGLPNMKKGQMKVLYSLCGVTQHSGRLASGHYTAYVKVRSQNWEATKQFLNLKPAGQYEIDRLVAEMARTATSVEEFHRGDAAENGESATADAAAPAQLAPPGKWYHISDGHVMEVTEKNVLQTQAYILFYERIL